MIEYILYSIIAFCIIIFAFYIFDAWRLRRLRKKYNPDDNRTRKGEEFTEHRGFGSITETKPNTSGFSIPQGRGLLQTTKPLINGEDSIEPRKINTVGNFISKLRRTNTA